ncbi:MAG TPA: CPBP family intramembrane glutamic endopeptidase [Candidatus Bathyarchaeia archaeon]
MIGCFEKPKREALAVAWTAVLFASSLGLILWRELATGEPSWWPWIHAIGLVVIFALTFVRANLKPLRSFVLILLIIFFFGFGGGWQFGVIPLVRSSSLWINLESQLPWSLSAIATHLLRFSPAVAILAFLLIMGRKRQDFFLAKGKIDAPVEPSKLLGMKKPEPWTRIGTIFAVVFASVTLIYLTLSSSTSLDAVIKALPLIPAAILIAVINAFNEEFTLRAAPISELLSAVGKKQALMITTVMFGLGHFYGVPSGLLGVLLASFLGWFLGKSMLETKGFFWAWLIHFLPDVFIFTFFAISAAA